MCLSKACVDWESGWCPGCGAVRLPTCARTRLVPAYSSTDEYGYSCRLRSKVSGVWCAKCHGYGTYWDATKAEFIPCFDCSKYKDKSHMDSQQETDDYLSDLIRANGNW